MGLSQGEFTRAPAAFYGRAPTLVTVCQPDGHYPSRRRARHPMAPSRKTVCMNNPLRILQTFDKRLSVPSEITLFGRAALSLGYPNPSLSFQSTQDVDGILPMKWLEPPERHEDFWNAVQATNSELEPDGLYLTHLFREIDIIIQSDWITRRVQ